MLKLSRKKLFGVWIVVLAITVATTFVGDYLYKASHYLNKLHFYISNGERELALQELNNFRYFYNLAKSKHIGWLANYALSFNEDKFELYSVAIDYITGDYKKVANLKTSDEINNYQIAHMIGSAKVRVIQAEYREEKNPVLKKKLMEKLVLQMLKDANPYFKKAVELSPEFKFPDPNFDDRWNYDITSEENSAKKVIQAQGPGNKKILLGIPKDPDGPIPGGGKLPFGEKKLNEETKPGAGGDPKKRG